MPVRIVHKLSSLIGKVLNFGAQDIKNEKQHRQIRLINKLSLAIFLLIISIGTTFYLLTFSPSILVPAAIESVLSVLPLVFNRRRMYFAAALTTFLVQCVATLYFGSLLREVLELQTVIFFLLLVSFILFNEPRSRKICCVVALLILVALESNSYLKIITPIPLSVSYSIVFKTLSFGGLFCLIIVVGYPYVVSHDANFVLKTYNNAKSIFIGNMSHELKSQISGILKTANSLRAITPDNRNCQELVSELTEACHSYQHMIANLLEYTKIDAGVVEEVNRQAINVPSLLRKIIKLYSRSALEDKGVNIELCIPKDFPEIIVSDELRLIQIFNNLISNAIKFTRKNSTIYIFLNKMAAAWFIIVKDSGNGISQEKLNSIYDPYVTERNVEFNPEGIGLGLFITKHIVEDLLKGKICAFNTPPLGATFEISLPLVCPVVQPLDQDSIN